MVVGGRASASYDVEVIDLDNENNECSKPANCPLREFSAGTFMNNAAFVCQDDNSKFCYIYDNKQGIVKTIFSFMLCSLKGL